MAAEVASGDVAMPENGREDGSGNQHDAQRVLSDESCGLPKDESARFLLRIALCDFVFGSDGRVGVAVLRQEGRLSGCESVRGIDANISRDGMAAAVHHAGARGRSHDGTPGEQLQYRRSAASSDITMPRAAPSGAERRRA